MITNKQELFTALRRNGNEIKISLISEDLLSDKDVIRGIASNYPQLLKELPEVLINDEVAKLIIDKSLSNFEFLPINFRQDKIFIMGLPINTSEELSVLKFSNSDILSDKDFICTLFEKFKNNNTPNDQYYFQHRFRDDEDNLYFYLAKNLKEDKDIINAARISSPIIFKDTPSELREDISFCESFIYKYPLNIQFAGESVKSNRDLIKHLISKGARVIKYVKDYFGSDREISELVVSNYGIDLEYFSPELQNDLDIVKFAIKQNPIALKFASDLLKDNNEIIEIAINEDGYALEFASERLKNDEHIVFKAINYKRTEEFEWGKNKKSSGGAFKFGSERILKIKELAILSLQNEGVFDQSSWGAGDHNSEKPLFAYLPESITNDENIIKIAIENNIECVRYINPTFRDSHEIKTLIRTIKEREKKDEKNDSGGWGDSTGDWK